MKDDKDDAELAAYGLIETCSAEEAEENAKIGIKAATPGKTKTAHLGRFIKIS